MMACVSLCNAHNHHIMLLQQLCFSFMIQGYLPISMDLRLHYTSKDQKQLDAIHPFKYFFLILLATDYLQKYHCKIFYRSSNLEEAILKDVLQMGFAKIRIPSNFDNTKLSILHHLRQPKFNQLSKMIHIDLQNLF